MSPLSSELGTDFATATPTELLLEKISAGTARVAVLGLGYVGLPLAVEFAKVFPTIGVDVDAFRVDAINAKRSYIGDVSDGDIHHLVESGALRATQSYDGIAQSDCIIICVPTPLDDGKQPDMSYIVGATEAISANLRRGQIVILESTTYPGTTDETLMPMFVKNGLRLDEDFLLAFSPERIDPGNRDFKIPNIPKIIGGCSPLSTKVAAALYGRIIARIHPVSSARVAETAKLWENTFRSVNIALANEMSILCKSLGIDTAEVIDAAATKPFGFMPFYPGPGAGGHCIPLDPHYLSWAASKYGYYPRFIMLADQINSNMADHVVALVTEALNDDRLALNGSRIFVLGITYKADAEDMRMSPAIPIIERLRLGCAKVRYYDRFVPRFYVEERELPPSPRRDLRVVATERRKAPSAELQAAITDGRRRSDPLESYPLSIAGLQSADCVLILTGHTDVDYEIVLQNAKLIVDTRNVIKRSGRSTDARVISL